MPSTRSITFVRNADADYTYRIIRGFATGQRAYNSLAAGFNRTHGVEGFRILVSRRHEAWNFFAKTGSPGSVINLATNLPDSFTNISKWAMDPSGNVYASVGNTIYRVTTGISPFLTLPSPVSCDDLEPLETEERILDWTIDGTHYWCSTATTVYKYLRSDSSLVSCFNPTTSVRRDTSPVFSRAQRALAVDDRDLYVGLQIYDKNTDDDEEVTLVTGHPGEGISAVVGTRVWTEDSSREAARAWTMIKHG